MHKLRRIVAVWVGKILIFAGKLFGKHGSSTPGKIALCIAPDILRHLSLQVRQSIIVVCGTNGKTTTNNFIYNLISAKRYKAVCNRLGANMLYGAVTAFVSEAKLNGNLDADYACIELDEFSAEKVFRHFTPDFIVITNLFRDQLDRYGEIDVTLNSLNRAVLMADKATLILNADDPLLASLGKQCNSKCVYFGVNSKTFSGGITSETKEGRFCRLCGAELEYDIYYYSQIGHYTCPACSFTRPTPEYAAENINLSNGITFDVRDTSQHIISDYRGFYNIYNILASYAVLHMCDIETTHINDTLACSHPQIGRMEKFVISGKQVILNLSKNPAGFNQSISTLIADERSKAVVLIINDNEQDGIDVSWLWDVDFERLNGITEFAVSGLRADDMLLRMKYAGFDIENIFINPKIREAISSALSGNCEVVYVLVNYTALFTTHNLLKKSERRGR